MKEMLVEEIYKIIKKNHNYDCFELAIFNLLSFNKDYLEWIDKETK